MKKYPKMNILLLLASISLAVAGYVNVYKIKAATTYAGWGVTSISSLIKDGQKPTALESDTVVLSHTGAYTDYEFYNSTGTLKDRFNKGEIKQRTKTVIVKKNDYIKMTNVGHYKGKMVDAVYTNTGDTEFSVHVTEDGNVTAEGEISTPVYGITVPRQFVMKLLEHGEEIPLKNVDFLLPTFHPLNIKVQGVYGYDMSRIKHFYGAEKIAADSLIHVGEGRYGIEIVGSNNPREGGRFYSVNGTTDALGNFNLYAGSWHVTSGGTLQQVNLIAPSEGSLLPIPYPTIQLKDEAKTIDHGKKMTLTMEQYLPEQSDVSYYPVNNSFVIEVFEDQANFLDIQPEDFEVTIGDQLISPSSSTYSLRIAPDNSIRVNLQTQFLRAHPGEMLSINQTSTIINDEALIKEQLEEQKLTFHFSSHLTYNLASSVQSGTVKLISDKKKVQVTVEPELTGKLILGNNLSTGTKISDIPIERLVQDVVDVTYSWDTVTASYDEPDKILDTAGTEEIKLNLTSTTFGNIVPLIATVTVQEGYTLSYHANGGQGTVPPQLTFTHIGVPLATGVTLSREGYTFGGWSDVATPTKETIIYQPGYQYGTKVVEQSNTVLYAVWNAKSYLTAEANGVQNVILGRRTEELDPLLVKKWVKEVKVKGAVLAPKDYDVAVKSELDATVIKKNIKIIVAVTSKKNINDHVYVEVLVDIVWGNTISMGEGQGKKSLLSLSLVEVETGYQVVAGFANTANSSEPFSSQSPDTLYAQIDYFNMELMDPNMEVIDTREQRGTASQVIEGKDTAEMAVNKWGNSQQAQPVKIGDIIRVWMSEPATEGLYTGSARILTASELPNSEWVYYRVTKNGFEVMYLNQLEPKRTVYISPEETMSQEGYANNYESVMSYLDIPQTIAVSKYGSVEAYGFKTYPKLALAVDEESEGDIYVREKDLVTNKPIIYSYPIRFMGAGEELEIVQPISNLSFEDTVITSYRQEVKRKEIDWGFTVVDRRATKSPWSIQAKMIAPFATIEGNSVLNGASLQLKSEGKQPIELNGEAQEIYLKESPEKINEVVWASDQGFHLNVMPGLIKKESSYQTTIDFQLIDAPIS